MAEGFYYFEEQIEYQKPQKLTIKTEKNTPKYENVSFFDDDVTVCANKSNFCDMMKINSYGKKNFEDITDDSFSKKKITTHFVPPDISAIKMLLEIYGKAMKSSEVSSMSDAELLQLKDQLIKEISNED